MRQVMMVSLGSNAYNIDEEGYRALRRYLDRASAGLKNNPDAAEILADLERGIGEKCAGVLNANKNVVTAEDIDRILREVGPVDGAVPEEPEAPPRFSEPEPAKTLHRRIRGSHISGVCTGLADYFGIDVLIVRLAFVALTFLSGVGLLMYIIMAFVVPSDTATTTAMASAPFPLKKLIIVSLLAVIALIVFFNMTGMMRHPGEAGLMMLFFTFFAPIAFFGAFAVVAMGVAFVVIRYLRSATR